MLVAVIEDRVRFMKLLINVEHKYVMKLFEFFKYNPFMKELSKNALSKFILANGGKGFGSLMVTK